MVFVSSSGGGLFGRPAIQTESGTFFIFRHISVRHPPIPGPTPALSDHGLAESAFLDASDHFLNAGDGPVDFFSRDH